MTGSTTDSSVILELEQKIKPILAHKGPEVQGGVLASLTAMWLAGNLFIGEDENDTAELRERLLQVFIETVRDLMPVYDKEIKAIVEGMKQ